MPRAKGSPGPLVVQSPRRRWAFRLLAAVVVPLLVLGVAELALRLAGFGHATSFFVPRQIEGKKVLVENSSFGLSFFPPALARGAPPVVMQASKPPGTYRIFLFGESAALGDPRPAYGVGRYLETLLQARYPETNFEVICVAMTAINSHAILPIARECAHYEGDLWIIYAGNNEMLGPFGASTVFGRPAPPSALVRSYLALQRTRLGQAFLVLWRRHGSAERSPGWGGMKMFLAQQLSPSDSRRERVYRNFEANLAAIIRAGTAVRVPIILSSVASNLKDCAPFGSLPPHGLAAPELARWQELFDSGVTNQANGQLDEALQLFGQAAAIAAQNPELQFRMGECLLQTGKKEKGRHCFVLARDLDALPFRADSRINRIIVEAARRNAQENVLFYDAVEALSASSPAGIPGQDSFYEHVHLNFAGNYRLARALAEVVARRFSTAAQSQPAVAWAGETLCNRRLGLTDWNRQAVLEEMKSRLLEPPFSNQLGRQERLRRLEQELSETETRSRAVPPLEARTIYEEAIKQRPGDHWLHHNFAEYLTRVGELAQATTEMKMVCRLVPQHYSGYFHTGRLLARQKKYDEADGFLQTALKLRPEFTDIYLELGRIEVSRGDKEKALSYCRSAETVGAGDGRVRLLEAKVFESLKRRGEAVASLREAIRLQPDLWEAHDLLGAELALEEKFAEAQAEFEEAVRLKPDYAEGHVNLGIALARQGRFAEAMAQFQEALRLEPGNRRAQEFLSAVEQMRKQRQ